MEVEIFSKFSYCSKELLQQIGNEKVQASYLGGGKWRSCCFCCLIRFKKLMPEMKLLLSRPEGPSVLPHTSGN